MRPFDLDDGRAGDDEPRGDIQPMERRAEQALLVLGVLRGSHFVGDGFAMCNWFCLPTGERKGGNGGSCGLVK